MTALDLTTTAARRPVYGLAGAAVLGVVAVTTLAAPLIVAHDPLAQDLTAILRPPLTPGFTCQSFASLSLDPPLVSLAPARTSSTWPRIRATGAFCVNVLADDHEHHSVRFARPGVDRFAGVPWTPGPGGAPVLDGVAAWVAATLEREYDGGDHTIAVGRVHALGADPARDPLLFHRGRYGRLRTARVS